MKTYNLSIDLFESALLSTREMLYIRGGGPGGNDDTGVDIDDPNLHTVH
jgi:hypothetical protein